MLGRLLDDSYETEVRRNLTLVTVTRLTAASGYRFVVPFLAVVARGLDVSVAEFGIALTIGDLTGLCASFVGRFVDRAPRKAAILGGLTTFTAGVTLAAVAPNLAVFAVALVVLGLGKMVFDLSILAWIADHVPPSRRGRVIAITETAWAASLFIGVTVLGAVTAVWSWRWGYAVIALAMASIILTLTRRLAPDPAPVAEHEARPHARVRGAALLWVGGMGCLLLASQLMLVMLGPWLEDDHGFSEGGITAVVFALGVVELVASTGAVRLVDHWGARESVWRGAVLILPASVLLAAGHRWLAVGIAAIAALMLGFEYAIVSAVSVGSTLVPGAPAAGIGVMMVAGTLGRATGSVVGTWLYDRHGAPGPATAAVVAAVAMAGLFVLSRWHSPHHQGAPGGR